MFFSCQMNANVDKTTQDMLQRNLHREKYETFTQPNINHFYAGSEESLRVQKIFNVCWDYRA